MRPVLFEIGPLKIYSFGLMMGIAFIVASYILTNIMQKKGFDQKYPTEITLLAIIFGIAGSKLLSVFENMGTFLKDPVGSVFSASGLTFYGGLILATISIYIYLRIKKIPFFVVADLIVPSLALAYGIGRIGCHLAGDGDYGIPTNLPWGTNYENGTVPPSLAFSDQHLIKHFPSITQQYPLGVPDNAPLHPTPIYEFLAALVIFYILWKLIQKNKLQDGKVFMVYLIFTGAARFFVEFLRLNPRYMLNLSEAQLISLGLIIVGSAGYLILGKMNKEKFVVQPVHMTKAPVQKRKIKSK